MDTATFALAMDNADYLCMLGGFCARSGIVLLSLLALIAIIILILRSISGRKATKVAFSEDVAKIVPVNLLSHVAILIGYLTIETYQGNLTIIFILPFLIFGGAYCSVVSTTIGKKLRDEESAYNINRQAVPVLDEKHVASSQANWIHYFYVGCTYIAEVPLLLYYTFELVSYGFKIEPKICQWTSPRHLSHVIACLSIVIHLLLTTKSARSQRQSGQVYSR